MNEYRWVAPAGIIGEPSSMAPSFSESIAKSVPVHNIFLRCGVGYIDRDRHTFAQTKQRARNLTVIANGLDGYTRPDIERARLNAKSCNQP